MTCILQCVKIFVLRAPFSKFILNILTVENLGSMAWRVGAAHLLVLLPGRTRQVLIAWVRRRITREGTQACNVSGPHTGEFPTGPRLTRRFAILPLLALRGAT